MLAGGLLGQEGVLALVLVAFGSALGLEGIVIALRRPVLPWRLLAARTIVKTIVVDVILAIVGVALGPLAALLFVLLRLGIGNDAEIVVGKLEVIFRLHPVVVQRCFVCQLAVLFQQLRGIAARAAVDPVDGVAATITATIVAAAAPTIVIALVVQRKSVSS